MIQTLFYFILNIYIFPPPTIVNWLIGLYMLFLDGKRLIISTATANSELVTSLLYCLYGTALHIERVYHLTVLIYFSVLPNYFPLDKFIKLLVV